MFSYFKKIRFSHIFWLFFYSLVFVILLKNSLSRLDPDLGWHLRVGQDIARTHQVASANPYNYSYTGNWVDHEWLANLLIFETYSHLGYPALAVISCLPFLLVLIILNILAGRKISSNTVRIISIAGLQLFGLLAALRYFGVRIQELAPLFLLIELIIISRYQRRKNPYLLIWLIPFFFVWANLHGSFLLGLVILFAWPTVKLIEKTFYRFSNPSRPETVDILSNKHLLVFFGFASLAFMVTLLTPYRLELYSFLFDYRNTIYLSLIEEWRSQFARPFNFLELAYIFTMAGTLAASLFSAIFKKSGKINIWNSFLVLLFLYLSLKSRRHLPLLLVVSFESAIIVIAAFFSAVFVRFAARLKSEAAILVLKLSLGAYLIVLIFSQAYNVRLIFDPFSFFSLDYPYDAVNYLKSNPWYSAGNILNSYEWGGYLIWNYPGKQIFIDGRFPQVEFAGHTLLEEYRNFFGSEKIIAEALARYDIGLVLVANKPENRQLSQYLAASGDWQLIYGDPVSLGYYRRP